MEEIGVVQSTDGIFAKVLIERKSICDRCTEGKCLLNEGGAIIEAFNKVNAKKGDKVKVILKPYTYLRGSIIIYGIPALSLIIGAIIGVEILSKFIKTIEVDLLSAIAGFIFFIIAFVGVRILTSKMERKIDYKPVIEEILSRKSENAEF